MRMASSAFSASITSKLAARTISTAFMRIRNSSSTTKTAGRFVSKIRHLTRTHCHGDCHGFNARISDAGNAAFFDFDDGGPGYLAYDPSVFLWDKAHSEAESGINHESP
jgi:Ser/Thr protein kinase RdoA (MazF antagonist)